MEQSAEQLKASLRELSQRRAQVEADIALRTARLEAAGVGMKGSLVDREGFPRADVDIPAIRADRQHVIALSNDHKALSAQMEQLLHALHAQSRHPGAPATPSNSGAAPMAVDDASPPGGSAASQQQQQQQPVAPLPLRPFAVVDEVSPGSPASLAGVQLGDQLVRFGGVTAAAGAGVLQQVAAALQAHEGREIEAAFLRHGAPVTLRLVPQKWAGRGLLGCHLQPL